MKYLKNFLGFMLLLCLLNSLLMPFIGDESAVEFVRTSPWVLLFYTPFCIVFAYCIGDTGDNRKI